MPPNALGRLLAGTAATLLLLTGCDDGSGHGSAATHSPEHRDLSGASLVRVAGDSPPARAIDETRAERSAWLRARAEHVAADLTARWERSSRARAPRPRPAYLPAIHRAAATVATADAPRTRVVSRDHATTTNSSADGPVTTTADNTTRIEDREATSRSTTDVLAGTPPGKYARTRTDTTTTTDLCPEGDEIAGEWSTEQVMELPTKGAGQMTIKVHGHGTFRRTADGSISIPDVTMTGTVSVVGQTTDPIQVTGSVGSWKDENGGDILKDIALVQNAGDRSTDAAYGVAAMVLLHMQPAIEHASRDGADRHHDGGICVRLDASADKTFLGIGEQATITVRVTDPETGEEIPGAEVTTLPTDGTVSPTTVTAPGTLTFTATDDRGAEVYLSVETPRGGDSVQLRFNVPGWRFEGVSYDAVTAALRIPTTTTWEGEVCGDPFTSSWRTRVVIKSSVASPVLEGSMVAVDVAEAPNDDRARLLIQAVDDPAPGAPPFRLWIDDHDPAADPSHQRIEVTSLEPLKGACVSR